jgi:hypothetical protein
VSEAVIVVPMLPAPALSANSRAHWRVRAAAARALRECACLATIAALADPATGASAFRGVREPVELSAVIAWSGRRQAADPTNAPHLLKAAIDGISDALWAGDDRQVHLGRIEQERGDGTVTVTLRRAPGNANTGSPARERGRRGQIGHARGVKRARGPNIARTR